VTKLQNRAIIAGLTVATGTMKSSAPIAIVTSLLLPFTRRNVNRIFSIRPS
jgi:hypothetical protein